MPCFVIVGDLAIPGKVALVPSTGGQEVVSRRIHVVNIYDEVSVRVAGREFEKSRAAMAIAAHNRRQVSRRHSRIRPDRGVQQAGTGHFYAQRGKSRAGRGGEGAAGQDRSVRPTCKAMTPMGT